MERFLSNFEKRVGAKIAPEFLERIEKSKLVIDDKVNFLLTKVGLKPASEITLFIKSDYEGGITEHMNESDVRESLDIIKESGLIFQLGEREVVKESYETEKEPGVKKFFQREQMIILIAHSKENLDFLIQALKTKSDELLGKTFGYSETAIEAFAGKKEKLDINTLPQEIRESDAILFSSPTLSKDNWQEEIKQGQEYAQFVKKISPLIYEEMKTISLHRLREIDQKENF